MGQIFQFTDNLCGLPLDPLQQVHVLLMVGVPELNAVLQGGSHKSAIEGKNHLPQPSFFDAGNRSFDAGWLSRQLSPEKNF